MEEQRGRGKKQREGIQERIDIRLEPSIIPMASNGEG